MKQKALMLRTCDSNMTGNEGLVWPESGPVTCNDWNPTPECGGGLHGFLWGEGDGAGLSWLPDAKWLVVEVATKDIVQLDGKIKVPSGEVVFCGAKDDAIQYLVDHGGAEKAIVGRTITTGHYSIAMAGYEGTATAGHHSIATVVDKGTATAGHWGVATAGDLGTATAGYKGIATAGMWGIATAECEGTATVRDYGTATAGDEGTAIAGFKGVAIAGEWGTATVGCGGTATVGDYGTATAGNYGTAKAGKGGIIIIQYMDDRIYQYRAKVGHIGEDGLKPNVAYHLNDDHEFEPKE